MPIPGTVFRLFRGIVCSTAPRKSGSSDQPSGAVRAGLLGLEDSPRERYLKVASANPIRGLHRGLGRRLWLGGGTCRA